VPVQDPQTTWDEYHDRKKEDRLREAAVLDDSMRSAGVTDETPLGLDFVHFGSSRQDVEALANQLTENYTVDVVDNADQSAWLAKGTTRPYAINLSKEQHIAWVGFMADVARSHACVFSTWSIVAPSLAKSFSSEQLESDA
jgi:hypothetical protein